MLKYDEWVVPGEVEYAERKAAEIEAKLQRYYEHEAKKQGAYWEFPMDIQITEHVIGEFNIMLWKWALYPPDIDVTNDMLLDWFRDQVALIDEPKIFELPDDDIRTNLPEWDDSMLPEDSRINIMDIHSTRYMASEAIEDMEGEYDYLRRELNLSEAKCNRLMEAFTNKIYTKNKLSEFTEQEEKIADCLKNYIYYGRHHYRGIHYECWYFPLAMTERDIVDVIHEAYLNASRRSRRIIPDKFDYINMDFFREPENYECLYQGKAGNMLIRFLFDYKNMKIVTAYPVLKKEIIISDEKNYYDKKYKCFYGA